jgi:drug/metabolite transporter (DMT)-like permease
VNTIAQRLLLTLATGALIGLQFVLAKLLLNAGLGQLTMSLVQIGGAALLLAAGVRLAGQRIPTDRASILYFALSALIAIAAGPLLGNWVNARIPTGIFALIVTLSPMFTTLFNAALDRHLPAPRMLAGAALGLIGVAIVLVPRVQMVGSVQALALSVAIGVPMLLAAGNVYRSRHWPQGLSASAATTGTLLTQAVMLATLLGAESQTAGFPLESLWLLLGLLIASTVASNLAGSLLQRVAGAAAYSQIGYVIALTGVAASALLFGDTLGPSFWPAMALVFTGIVITNRSTTPAPAQRGLTTATALSPQR